VPTLKPENKGLLVVLASFYLPVSCCKTLRDGTSGINGLQTVTNHSAQHGRNTAVRFSFANLLACPLLKTCGVAACFIPVSEGNARKRNPLTPSALLVRTITAVAI
jgi:hypothetical protein